MNTDEATRLGMALEKIEGPEAAKRKAQAKGKPRGVTKVSGIYGIHENGTGKVQTIVGNAIGMSAPRPGSPYGPQSILFGTGSAPEFESENRPLAMDSSRIPSVTSPKIAQQAPMRAKNRRKSVAKPRRMAQNHVVWHQ